MYNGPGYATFKATSNSYSGGTVINGGTLGFATAANIGGTGPNVSTRLASFSGWNQMASRRTPSIPDLNGDRNRVSTNRPLGDDIHLAFLAGPCVH